MADVFIPRWLRGTPLAQVYEDAWVETGDTALALEAVREAPLYDTYFPGNRREDGTLIHDEQSYSSVVEAYEDALLSFNVNPDIFRSQFGAMIQGLKSPAEFADDLEQRWEGIVDQIPQVRQWYVDQGFADDLTVSAIFASALDPDIGNQIAAGNIALAQVGGQAASRGFNIGIDFARQVAQAGVDTSSEANQFFSLAQGMLPTFSVMASRHLDPDDDFDLEEFTQAQLFEDPEQRRRMRRLLAQERASFTDSIAGVGAVSRAQSGQLVGLERL